MGLAKGKTMSKTPKWPTTVDQAVGVLFGMLPEDEKSTISAMSADDLINLHFGLGIDPGQFWPVVRQSGVLQAT